MHRVRDRDKRLSAFLKHCPAKVGDPVLSDDAGPVTRSDRWQSHDTAAIRGIESRFNEVQASTGTRDLLAVQYLPSPQLFRSHKFDALNRPVGVNHPVKQASVGEVDYRVTD
jgi:hypothetical protein